MSNRNNNHPDNFNNNIGFRLVVAPILYLFAGKAVVLPGCQKLFGSPLYGGQPGKKDSAAQSRSRPGQHVGPAIY